MSTSKHFDKIAWSVTALMLVITILFMNGAALGIEAMAHTMGYESRLFDNTRVHTIDIVMNDWDTFIANAASEEYYTANVVIDGEAYKNVGIRGKGNTSLSTVSSMDSYRYSFKIEFDQYDSSISYHGLDKLSLNNLIQDSTMMKDYLTYTMMNAFGVSTPLCSFVYITVNGEDWGLYLAVEGVEDSFLERNYGSDYGELYKPDSMSFGGGRGNGMNFDMNDFMNNSSSSEDSDTSEQNTSFPQMPDMGNFDPSQMQGDFSGAMPDMGDFDPTEMAEMFGGEMPDMDASGFGGKGGFGGMSMGSDDVKLQYIDDSIDSYSNIWNNAKTDITEADQTRLIESLRKLSEGEQIESVVDIEQVIRYFVVHNFVCNGDSYTGSMIHNADASGITLSDMGSMNMGGGGMQNMGGNRGEFSGGDSFGGKRNFSTESGTTDWTIQGTSAAMPEGDTQTGTVPEMPEGFDPTQMTGGDNGQMPEMGDEPEGFAPSQMTGGDTEQMPGQEEVQVPADGETQTGQENAGRTSRDNMQMPGGDFNFSMNGTGTPASDSSGWLWIGISLLILCAGLVIAKLYRY